MIKNGNETVNRRPTCAGPNSFSFSCMAPGWPLMSFFGRRTRTETGPPASFQPLAGLMNRPDRLILFVGIALIAAFVFGIVDVLTTCGNRFASASRPTTRSPWPSCPLRTGVRKLQMLSSHRGMEADLHNRISVIRDIRTLSVTAMESYTKSARELTDIGDELGVSAILEGEVERTGDQVRLKIELMDAESGSASGPSAMIAR